jgi:hypothetical protein
MNQKTLRSLLILTVATCLITFLVWLPHLLRMNFYGLNFSEGFNTIYRNFDGIEYIIIGKTFYNERAIASLPQELPHTYYAAHFPFYSMIILVFEPVLGFLKSMVLVTVLSTIASVFAFYFLVRDFKLTSQPLWLSLVFLVLPARWLITHSVGSSEPTFIFFTITAVYYFLKYEQKKDYYYISLAGMFGLLAQLTRPPGILLFIALGIYILWKSYSKNSATLFKNIFKSISSYFPLILIPVGLLSIFVLYLFVYKDFFAYFHSGDNIHLSLPPFQIFNSNQYWVGSIWLEDIIYIYIVGLFAGITLLKNNVLRPLGIFILTYMTASIFIAHRDISRYVLPAFPFALIAYEKVLTSKEFKVVLGIVFLGIYLYTQNFLLQNTAPFPNPQLFN